MIKRFDIGSIRLMFSIASVIKVIGVNSYVGEGEHILMWDFDDVSLDDVKQALLTMQARYWLSDVHILNTGRENSYHAYCFTRVDWRRAVEILAATPYVDMKYVKWCLFRGRLTLRTGDKVGRLTHKVATLEGYCLPDTTVNDLKSWVIYETMGGKEWLTRQMRKWQGWLIRWTYPLKLRQLTRSGRKH